MPAPQPATAEPVPYDFQRPTTLAREHARVLGLTFETFARQWASQLGTSLHTKVIVNAAPAQLMSYTAYVSSLPSSSALMLLDVGLEDSRGVLQVPVGTASNWISRMLGYAEDEPEADRSLTGTEVKILRQSVVSAMEALHYSFNGVLATSPIPEPGVHYNPGFAQAAAPSDLMVVVTLTVTTSAAPATVTLALPAEGIIPRLGDSNPVNNAQDAARLALEQLAATPVDVVLEASHVRVPSMRLLSLQVGDVITLPHTSDAPYNLTVDGHRLATAQEVAVGSRKFMQITETEMTQ